jgi:hypothetical protein
MATKQVKIVGTTTYRSIYTPTDKPSDMLAAVQSLKEVVEVMTGQRGTGEGAVITSKYVITQLSKLSTRIVNLEVANRQTASNYDDLNNRIVNLENIAADHEARIHALENPPPIDPPPGGGGSDG